MARKVSREIVRRAVEALGITVPLTRYEPYGNGGVKIWPYGQGGDPVTWEPRDQAGARSKAKPKRRTTKKKAVKDE